MTNDSNRVASRPATEINVAENGCVVIAT